MTDSDLASVPFERVLKAEHECLWRRRNEAAPPPFDDPIADAHRLDPFGLALSGGGIRSATFNLGVLQGLAENDLLSEIDYLSTVSGGGYIGALLCAYVKDFGIDKASEMLLPYDGPEPRSAREDPIAFLRRYSNYLAPRPGLFSADTWVMGATWFRNFLLNQLVLIPALASLVLAAYLVYFVQFSRLDVLVPYYAVPLAVFLLLALALPVLVRHLRAIARQGVPSTEPLHRSWELSAAVERLAPVLVFVAAAVLSASGPKQVGSLFETYLPVLSGIFFALFWLLQTAGGFTAHYLRNRQGFRWLRFLLSVAHPLWMSALSALVCSSLLYLWWTSRAGLEPWAQVTLGPPFVTLAILLSLAALTGLMGADYPDGAREALTRGGTLVVQVAAAWLGLFGIAFYGPYLVALALGQYGNAAVTALTAWIGTGAAGLLFGRRQGTERVERHDEPHRRPIVDWLIAVAPPLVIVGYLIVVSLGVHQVLQSTLPLISRSPIALGLRRPSVPESFFENANDFAAQYHSIFVASGDATDQMAAVAALLALSLIFLSVASARVDINEFSLHYFYKNRLVRCYLGAARAVTRRPSRLTGFDARDDFPLSCLTPERGYRGPHPIFNTTLNVNVGTELSQQERKGKSFVLTPTYCGYHIESRESGLPPEPWFSLDQFEFHGYRKTSLDGTVGYGSPQGPTIGQAMAVSGAAASPNSGYSTSPPMAFILTLFDIRLGWWLGNPRWKAASRRPGPWFALKYLIAELTASTTAATRFVNLSDGGHFDNLGLYELVRRRCRYIIVSDGEQDGEFRFGSLGSVVRKCRADFGVEINIDPAPIRLTNGRGSVHCVIGTVLYPELDSVMPRPLASMSDNQFDVRVRPGTAQARGWLLYLKASVTGDESMDITQYHADNPRFPHETTADQFFSESQFESYRRLGLHIVREAFAGFVVHQPGFDKHQKLKVDLTRLFQGLTTKWYQKLPVEPSVERRLNERYFDLLKRCVDMDLPDAGSEGMPDLAGGPPWPGDRPSNKELVLLLEQVQLMESVFVECGFESMSRRANPHARRWLSIFRGWLSNPALREGVWPRVRHSYDRMFQEFVERLYSHGIEDFPMQN